LKEKLLFFFWIFSIDKYYDYLNSIFSISIRKTLKRNNVTNFQDFWLKKKDCVNFNWKRSQQFKMSINTQSDKIFYIIWTFDVNWKVKSLQLLFSEKLKPKEEKKETIKCFQKRVLRKYSRVFHYFSLVFPNN